MSIWEATVIELATTMAAEEDELLREVDAVVVAAYQLLLTAELREVALA